MSNEQHSLAEDGSPWKFKGVSAILSDKKEGALTLLQCTLLIAGEVHLQ